MGPKSDQLTAKTKGVEPTVPEAHRFLEVSTMSVTLHLNAWVDGGCPIVYFVVEYKLAAVDTWSTGKLHICRRGLEEESLEIINN